MPSLLIFRNYANTAYQIKCFECEYVLNFQVCPSKAEKDVVINMTTKIYLLEVLCDRRVLEIYCVSECSLF